MLLLAVTEEVKFEAYNQHADAILGGLEACPHKKIQTLITLNLRLLFFTVSLLVNYVISIRIVDCSIRVFQTELLILLQINFNCLNILDQSLEISETSLDPPLISTGAHLICLT